MLLGIFNLDSSSRGRGAVGDLVSSLVGGDFPS